MPQIRTAQLADLEALFALECACFPARERAQKEDLRARILLFSNHFYLLEHNGQLLGFINGMVSDEADLRDEMYHHAELHNENGAWQMIFGLDVYPQFWNRGYGSMLMRHMIGQSRIQGRQGLVLTCKKEKISYYERFGYQNESRSSSVHGGCVWYAMRLLL